jgi:hypothetical protein
MTYSTITEDNIYRKSYLDVVHAINRAQDGEQPLKRTRVKTWEPKLFWNHHHEVVRLSLLGHKPEDISKILAARGISLHVASVKAILGSPMAKRHLQIMSDARDARCVDVAIEIKRLAPKAIAIIEKLLSEAEEGVLDKKLSHQVAMDALDRAGYGAVQKVAVAHGHLTKEDIEDIKARAAESGILHKTEVSTNGDGNGSGYSGSGDTDSSCSSDGP